MVLREGASYEHEGTRTLGVDSINVVLVASIFVGLFAVGAAIAGFLV